jgi:hypothetical protein
MACWGLISRLNSKDFVPGAASICYVPELIDAPVASGVIGVGERLHAGCVDAQQREASGGTVQSKAPAKEPGIGNLPGAATLHSAQSEASGQGSVASCGRPVMHSVTTHCCPFSCRVILFEKKIFVNANENLA